MVRQAARQTGARAQAVALVLLLTTGVTAQVKPGPAKKLPTKQPAKKLPAKQPAKQPTKTAPPQQADNQPPKLLDEVMMTVDNRVILRGEVEAEYRAMLAGEFPDGGHTARDRAILRQRARFKFLREAMAAQSAWSIPGSTPDRIAKILEREMERRTTKRVNEAGGLNKYRQDAGLLASSEFIRERREREKILRELAQQELSMRMRDRLALMITPKMLRAHYAKRRPEMQTEASVELGIVILDGTSPEAGQKAEQARKAWTDSLLTAEEVAKQAGGAALTKKTGDPLDPQFLEFMKQPEGTVSKVLRKGPRLYVLKVTNRSAGNDFRWNDPKVQNFLREELGRVEFDRIMRKMDRERQKTLKIWPPLDRGRR